MTIQPQSLITIGVLLLALVTVESGGLFLKKVAQGDVPTNDLQKSFYRAGHAHAAVLIVLSVAILSVIDNAGLTGFWEFVARDGVPIAAILMPAGFFLSVIGRDPQRPNRFVVLLWAGVVSLTAGLLVAGVGLLTAGIAAL
jgi:uncharacterized membrane protein (DUF441 family)